MKATLTFTGIPFSGVIKRHQYQSGNKAVALILEDDSPEDRGEPLATLTFNPHQPVALGPNECVIKDYSENEGVFAQLIALGVVRDTGKRVPSGFVVAPIAEIVEPTLRVGSEARKRTRDFLARASVEITEQRNQRG